MKNKINKSQTQSSESFFSRKMDEVTEMQNEIFMQRLIEILG